MHKETPMLGLVAGTCCVGCRRNPAVYNKCRTKRCAMMIRVSSFDWRTCFENEEQGYKEMMSRI